MFTYGSCPVSILHGKGVRLRPVDDVIAEIKTLKGRKLFFVDDNLVEKLDFVTTPGYLDGPGSREAAGLPPGTGPYKVITDLAVLGFDEETKQMQIETLHPGITLEQVPPHPGLRITRS